MFEQGAAKPWSASEAEESVRRLLLHKQRRRTPNQSRHPLLQREQDAGPFEAVRWGRFASAARSDSLATPHQLLGSSFRNVQNHLESLELSLKAP